MGLQHARIAPGLPIRVLKCHAANLQIVDEFVAAVMGRWPKCVLQFEDFNMATAHPLLQRYRNCHLVFNDDIQGTAATGAQPPTNGCLQLSVGNALPCTTQMFITKSEQVRMATKQQVCRVGACIAQNNALEGNIGHHVRVAQL